MTDDIRALAADALEVLRSTRKEFIYASRPGIVAGVPASGSGFDRAFRRVNGRVRLETWPMGKRACGRIRVYELPDDLERQAAKILDNL